MACTGWLNLGILISFVLALTEANELFTAYQGKHLLSHSKMGSFRFLGCHVVLGCC